MLCYSNGTDNKWRVLHGCSTDSERELDIVRQKAVDAGAFGAVVCTHWAQGGAGALQLAEAVIAASKQPSHFQFLYELDVCISHSTVVLYTFCITVL